MQLRDPWEQIPHGWPGSSAGSPRIHEGWELTERAKGEPEATFNNVYSLLTRELLEPAEDKTTLLRFGRFAERETARCGEGAPGTGDGC